MTAVFPGRVTAESLPQLLCVLAGEVKRGDALLLNGLHFEVFVDAELIPPPPGHASTTPSSAIITYEGSHEGEPCGAWVSYPENERVLVRRPIPFEEPA